jgi:basic membrane protein A
MDMILAKHVKLEKVLIVFFAQTKWFAFQDNDYENFMSNYVNDSDSYLGAVENNIHVVCIGSYSNNDYFQNNEIIFIYTVDKDYNFSLWDVIIDGEEYEHFQRPVLIEAIYPEFGSGDIADKEMLIDNAKYKVALLLNGNLGDKSFFDSAHEGLQKLKDELGDDEFSFKVVEMGATPADEGAWEPTLMNYCESREYDIIIVGTWQMSSSLSNAAERYPDQKFILFDEIFDFDTFNSKFIEGQAPQNIYNVLYKSNEVSFLVGATAAMMTSDSNMNMIDSSNKKIGFIGGMETAFIHDHLIGYLQGAKYIDSDIEIAIDYIENFYDSAAGKDLAIRQYADGVDVGFNVAGGAGLGQIEAAYDTGKWAFGIDANQATLLPNMANNIPTSAIKNIGNSLIRAIKLDINGYLKYGIIELVGLKEGCVGLVKDSHYENTIPKYIRETVDKLESDIINGNIVVETSLNKNSRDAKALIERIR